MAEIENKIKDLLRKEFLPDFLEVINESYKHKNHMGDNGSGESHFKITIASSKLKSSNRIANQRAVYSVLDNLLKDKIHALSIHILK